MVAAPPEVVATVLPSEAAALRSPSTSTAPQARPVVWVAQSDSSQAAIIAISLHLAGVAVRVIPNGFELLLELQRGQPDALVLDLGLPVVSGYRVLNVLRRDPLTCDIPVMLISDLTFQEVLDVVHLGVEGFYTKPVSVEDLVEHVYRLVLAA